MTMALSTNEFNLIRAFLYRQAGIHMRAQKITLIQNRLRKRIKDLGLNSYREYYEHIIQSDHKDELQKCLNALTTNETYFFRHKGHWDFTGETAIPEWMKSHPNGGSFRVWSAASSSGEEAYSISIASLHHFGVRDSDRWRVEIDATDINEEVLERARRGVYGRYAVQKLTPFCVKRFFNVKKGDQDEEYHLKDTVKERVRFSKHNLLRPKSGSKYNMVFLRNVLIYFDEDSKRRVLRNVADSLESGGYLLLGGSESLGADRGVFEYVMPTIFRRL